MREVRIDPNLDSWRESARSLLRAGIRPVEVVWKSTIDDQSELALSENSGFRFGAEPTAGGLFDSTPLVPIAAASDLTVPAEFIAEAKFVAAHRDPLRWSLLYRALWRLTHGEPELLKNFVDPDVAKFHSMSRSVHRDLHKMKAFVRFREVREEDGTPRYIAWHRPDHLIVHLAAPFFQDRFNGMRWSILTEDECVHWDGDRLEFTPGVPRSHAPKDDDAEALWKTYYASIFNPARLKLGAMRKEMAVRYWKTLPEAALIPDLIRDAPGRVEGFYETQRKKPDAKPFLPPAPARGDALAPPPERYAALRAAAANCRACDLCERATQTVFGEGPLDARIVFVGEQPGDQEDREGRPFIGPAGKLFDEALHDAGLDRQKAYVTNAVKHFNWTPSGKIRLHQKPKSTHIAACDPWLREEIGLVKPEVLVCLGVTAAQSVLGKTVRLGDVRGKFHETPRCARTLFTIHPSAILRTADPVEREAEYRRFVEDLRSVTT